MTCNPQMQNMITASAEAVPHGTLPQSIRQRIKAPQRRIFGPALVTPVFCRFLAKIPICRCSKVRFLNREARKHEQPFRLFLDGFHQSAAFASDHFLVPLENERERNENHVRPA